MPVKKKLSQHAKMPCLNEIGPLDMPYLERHRNGTYSIKPGELVLKLLTIFRQPTGCLDVGVLASFPGVHDTVHRSTIWGIRKTLMLVICTYR